jgi:hypothetical protein
VLYSCVAVHQNYLLDHLLLRVLAATAGDVVKQRTAWG